MIHRFNNLNMAIKLTLLFLPIVLVFFIGDEFTFRKMQQSFYQETVGTSIESLEVVSAGIDDDLDNIKRVFSALSKDENLRNYVKFYSKTEYVSGSAVDIELGLSQQFRTFSSALPRVDSIGVIVSRYRLKQQLMDGDKDLVLVISDFVKSGHTFTNEELLSLKDYGWDGYIYLYPFFVGSSTYTMFAVLDENYFQSVLDVSGRSSTDYYIFDGENLLFATDSRQSSIEAASSAVSIAEKPEFLNGHPTSSLISHGDSITYVISPIPSMDWVIISQQSNMYPYAVMESAYTSNLLMRLVVILFAVLLFISIIRGFSKRIKEINYTMERIAEGNLNFRFSPVYSDEISQLGRNLNNMVAQIRVKEAEISHRKIEVTKAQLKALQNQINPHFLYNSLENIRMKAIESGNNQIAEQISTMGDMLRYNIRNDLSTVTIQEEYEQVTRYLSMQKHLLKDRLTFTIDVDPTITNCDVVKFLLQPLAENAIIHGISNKLTSSELNISIKKEDERIFFTVSDTGLGISDLKMDEIKLLLSSSGPPSSGDGSIGLQNVNKRLILFYGPDSALDIESKLGVGTLIRFSIPVTREKKHV